MVRVKIQPTKQGALIISLVSWRHRDKLRAYLEQAGAQLAYNGKPSVGLYLQGEDEVSSFLSRNCTREKAKSVGEGYTEVILMEPCDYGTYVGNDAGENWPRWCQ